MRFNRNRMIVNEDISLTSCELSSLIGDIYDSSFTGDWDLVLEKLMLHTASNKALFHLLTYQDNQPLLMGIKTNFDYNNNLFNQFRSRFGENPYYQAQLQFPEGETVFINEYVSAEQVIDLPVYEEILKPFKAFYSIVGIMQRDGKHDAVYCIHRDINEPPYGTKEVNLLKLLTPHMSRAMKTYQTLKLYKNYVNISKSIMDQTDQCILVCDPQGKVIFANELATELLVKPSQVYFSGSFLSIQQPIYNQMLHDLISNSCHSNVLHNENTIIIEQDTKTIVICVLPLKQEHDFIDIDVNSCLVTIKLENTIKWQTLQNEFSLTPKELALLKDIYNKKKLHEIANQQKTAYNTLRVHLYSVFKKMSVNSQSELMLKTSQFNF